MIAYNRAPVRFWQVYSCEDANRGNASIAREGMTAPQQAIESMRRKGSRVSLEKGMRRSILKTFGFSLLAACLAMAGGEDVVMWPQTLEWEDGPPGLRYRVTFGSLTVFRASGEFVKVNCELMRDDPAGPVMFNLKSGYSVFVGRWEAGGRHVKVVSRLVAREKLAVAKNQFTSMPGPIVRETWELLGGKSISTASSIRTPGGQLVVAPSLHDPVELEKVLRHYSKSAVLERR